MKKINCYTFILSLVIIITSSCVYDRKIKKEYTVLNFKDSFSIKVNKQEILNNDIILNDTFATSDENFLIFKELKPTWLFKNYLKNESAEDTIIISPKLYDVKVPYTIVKNKNSNVFTLIKDKDPLKFYLFIASSVYE